ILEQVAGRRRARRVVQDRAVAFAAAPFAGAIAQAAARNPAVVSERPVKGRGTGDEEGAKHEQRAISAEHGQGPFIVPARQLLVTHACTLSPWSDSWQVSEALRHDACRTTSTATHD